MKKITVPLKGRGYEIMVAGNALAASSGHLKKLSLGDCAYILTHDFLRKEYGTRLTQCLRHSGVKEIRYTILPPTEKNKSINTAIRIINDILKNCTSKKVFLIAFGGGVIGDLTGFIASVYKRGIPYIQIPTTLLSQVDAAIGGKTAVDTNEAKNIIGAFYQPRMVITDTSILRSLDARQLKSGLSEIIKYALIQDKKLFAYLEKNQAKIMAKDPRALEYIIACCSAIKARIVAADERETKGLRTILNFGHTIGHAIETAGGYVGCSHGEAVAIGMRCALRMSFDLRLLSKTEYTRAIGLLDAYGLAHTASGICYNRARQALVHDKKFIGGKTRFVLLRKIGKATIREKIPLSTIEKYLREITPS